jgi:hypothetical protein
MSVRVAAKVSLIGVMDPLGPGAFFLFPLPNKYYRVA